eukprot:7151651-Pyramimonas_sp.AAC.1
MVEPFRNGSDGTSTAQEIATSMLHWAGLCHCTGLDWMGLTGRLACGRWRVVPLTWTALGSVGGQREPTR